MAFELDGRIKDWAGTVVKGVELSFTAPDGKKAGRGVGLYLVEVIQSPLPSTIKRPPLQLSLKYLITTWSDKPEDAHEMLVKLMFAAIENKDFQVGLEPIPLSVWASFGIPPQPSFMVCVPLQQERPEPPVKLVREPLKVQTSPMVAFYGLLLGPGDVPLSGCRVEIPALSLATRTDHKGRFHFPSVPAAGSKRLIVKAKGSQLPVNSEQNYPDSRTPLVIHFSPLEG